MPCGFAMIPPSTRPDGTLYLKIASNVNLIGYGELSRRPIRHGITPLGYGTIKVVWSRCKCFKYRPSCLTSKTCLPSPPKFDLRTKQDENKISTAGHHLREHCQDLWCLSSFPPQPPPSPLLEGPREYPTYRRDTSLKPIPLHARIFVRPQFCQIRHFNLQCLTLLLQHRSISGTLSSSCACHSVILPSIIFHYLGI